MPHQGELPGGTLWRRGTLCLKAQQLGRNWLPSQVHLIMAAHHLAPHRDDGEGRFIGDSLL